MSLASDYAAAVATKVSALNTTQATVPAPWAGPQGLSASVTNNGDCQLNFGQQQFNVPAAVLVAFGNWITTTFV
jgi:hypothetical protein